jgi:hypothetical protein
VQHDPERKSHKIGIGIRARRIPGFSICFIMPAVNAAGQSVRSSQLIPILLGNLRWQAYVPKRKRGENRRIHDQNVGQRPK